MKRGSLTLLTLAITAAAAGGVWIGQSGIIASHVQPAIAGMLPQRFDISKDIPSGAVIYYRDPDSKPIYASGPKTTPDGRAFVPVRASEDIRFDLPAESGAVTVEAEGDGKRILYYRHPMGLPDVSSAPKKDSMGMNYIPVYEGEAADESVVTLSPGKIQRAGVKSVPVSRQVISVPVRAPGTLQLDERRIAVIAMRSEAFVESVEDVTTGTAVVKGQPLFRVYSPTIANIAAEYLTVLRTASAAPPQWSKQRLLNLAVPPELITAIEENRKVPLVFTWTAPRDGYVLERNIVEGARVMPGDALFRIADHSVLWALVDVSERDLARVKTGQAVKLRVRSFPGRDFQGRVEIVYPHLDSSTRTVRVRIEIDNADLALKPDMYVEAEIDTGTGDPVLAVPENAVIDSGDRQIVLVDKGEGRFEPRPVVLGYRGNGLAEIKAGISEGDAVVTSANFLIDAESNLKAALSGYSAAAGSAP